MVPGVEERERKRLTSVSSSANVVGLDSEVHASSATTPQLFIMKNADNKLRCLFSFSFPNDEKQCWSGEGERKAGAALSGQNFVPHWTDPRSDAQQKHLRRSYGSGLFKGSLKTFLEHIEYASVSLHRFKLVRWGLPVTLEKLCSGCFHPAVFLFKGI